MDRKTLNDVWTRWQVGEGVFQSLSRYDVPWTHTTTANMTLDFQYHGNRSGQKFISPLVNWFSDRDHGALLTAAKNQLVDTICAMYLTNWNKLWATMSFEYNPIENYRMVETMTDDETVTEYGKTSTRTDNLTHRKTGTETLDVDETVERTDNLSHGKTGTETRTDNLTDTTTPNLTTTTSNSVHGFNSSVGVPSDDQTVTATGTNTETHTGTEQRSYNLTETDTGTQSTETDAINETTFNTTDTDTGTQANVDSGSDTQTRNYELTRSGNIGVTTSQQMIESERALWVWNFFNDVVFPDIDRVLTLQIY